MAETDIPKLGKSVTVEVGERKVELTRVPIRRYDWAHTAAHVAAGGHPREQALLEIRVDGEFVGRASRPYGWGAQAFSIEGLWRAHRHGWPEEVRFGRGYVPHENRLFSAAQIARKAVELRDEVMWGNRRQLMTEAEIKASNVAHAAEERRRDAEAEERRKQWDREREQQRQRAIEHRDEVLMGLRELAAREDLTNLERAALTAAIQRYEGDRL